MKTFITTLALTLLTAGSATAASRTVASSHRITSHATGGAHTIPHNQQKIASKHPASKGASTKPHPMKTSTSAGKASAQKPQENKTKPSTGQTKPGDKYHVKHGTPFVGGICYKGRTHCHWSYSGYSSRYGCMCYWCPSTCCYYYWYEPACCYYPITYYKYAPAVETVKVSTEVCPPPAGVPALP